MRYLSAFFFSILCFAFSAAAQTPALRLEVGKPVESDLQGSQSHFYGLAVSRDDFINVRTEQKGIDVVIRLLAPDRTVIVEIDSPNGTKGDETLWFVADAEGEYLAEVASLEKNSPAGKYEISLVASRRATHQDLHDTAAVLGNIARTHFGRDNSRCRALAARSLALAERAGHKVAVANGLGLIGNTYAMEGDLRSAADHHSRALAIWEELKDPRAALATNNLGIVFSQLGDAQTARLNFEKSYQVMLSSNRKADAAVMLYNIALVYRGQGDYAHAMEYLEKSDAMFREAGRIEMPPDLAINFAGVYRRKGDIDLAIAYYDKALAAFELRKDRYGVYQTLHGLGAAYLDKNDLPKAVDYLKKAAEMQRQMNSRLDLAGTLRQIGDAYVEMGRLVEADQSYDESLKIAVAAQSPAVETDILTSRARLLPIERKPAEALVVGVQAREKAASLTEHPRTPELHSTLARAYLALGNTTEAKKSLTAAIEDIEFVSGVSDAKDSDRAPFDLLTQLLIDLGEHNEAFQTAERARSRVLINSISGGGREIAQAMSRSERDAEKRLFLDIASLNKQLGSARERMLDTAAIDRIARDLKDKRLALEDLRSRIYAAHPEIRIARGQMKRITLPETDSMVNDGRTALIQYVVTDDKTLLFLITRGGSAPQLKVFVCDEKRAVLEGKIERYRSKIENGDLDFGKASNELYSLILKPAFAELTGKTRLVIVPDGPLWDLPFHTLQDGNGRPLVEKASISYAPSLTALREMKKRAKGRSTGMDGELLAFGNPIVNRETSDKLRRVFMNEKLDPLPDAERLVAGLAKMYGPARSKIYTRGAAREQIAKDEAPKFRIVQFATHGILNNVSPMYSHLVLARDEKDPKEDGLLEAWEMKDLDLKADMVILSACDTARGKISGGEGVVGMTWAMFIAGAPTTVASQWKVESSSTTEFMLEFHRQLLGKQKISKAEALRRASLKLMKMPKYRHPSYWGAWVMVGDGS